MAKITRSAGFTIIEMVITAGLLGMLSVGLTSVLLISLRSRVEASTQAELKAQGDHAITSMERTIRNAKSISNCGANQIRFSVPDPINKAVTHTYTYQYISVSGVGRITLTDSVDG